MSLIDTKAIKEAAGLGFVSEKAIEIWYNFNPTLQKQKLMEECQELLLAPHDKSEIADVFIMALQHFLMDPQVQHHVRDKVNRTLDRIDSGYYR